MTISPDDDNWAAEYALGTLDSAERAVIAARRQREPDLDLAIQSWESRLGPLLEAVPALAPPQELWSGIDAKISGGAGGNSSAVVDLTRRLSRWRTAALAASGIAAALAVGIGLQESTRRSAPHEYVAVLQKSADSPAFMVTVNLDQRSLIVRPVAASAPAGKSYELWIIDQDKLGSPRSLGVIDAANVTAHPKLATYDRAVVQEATYAVTVEPEGGSPDGRPSGAPVFVGKLIPTGQ